MNNAESKISKGRLEGNVNIHKLGHINKVNKWIWFSNTLKFKWLCNYNILIAGQLSSAETGTRNFKM
jgi:hypothetical protein